MHTHRENQDLKLSSVSTLNHVLAYSNVGGGVPTDEPATDPAHPSNYHMPYMTRSVLYVT